MLIPELLKYFETLTTLYVHIVWQWMLEMYQIIWMMESMVEVPILGVLQNTKNLTNVSVFVAQVYGEALLGGKRFICIVWLTCMLKRSKNTAMDIKYVCKDNPQHCPGHQTLQYNYSNHWCLLIFGENSTCYSVWHLFNLSIIHLTTTFRYLLDLPQSTTV